MLKWLIILGVLYIGVLIFLSWKSKKTIHSANDFMLGGAKIGLVLGFMTFAATLFSTFTLMGMPDFSRKNGVGAWIFLTFSDAVMVFFILWFGFYLRKKVGQNPFHGMSALLQKCYNNKQVGYLYFACVFIFLIPYVAIQIRGVSIFLHAAFPNFISIWIWAVLIVVVMMVYSELGGLKAIIYADFLQGTLLLIVVWLIAFNCLNEVGGWSALFEKTQAINKQLLTAPGPNKLLTPQFLIASCIAILMIPVTQPQLSTRLVIMKDYNALKRMAVAVGIFATLVILPTIIIGLYGSIYYTEASTAEFLGGVLLSEQNNVIASLTIIGLFAAAMSTSDSQLFAMGNEVRGLMQLKESQSLRPIRLFILLFSISALLFSLISSDELVLLARLSFSGTAIMGPLIILGILANKPQGLFMVWISLLGLLVFILTQLNILPQKIGLLRMDLLIMIVLSLCAFANYLFKKDV
ncbi:MAG: sodium:solute symporter family protein [Flavobacteriaceae bacterium]|nr:sodium:solute symporter family protein [Flavobacteriaceae bacterium]